MHKLALAAAALVCATALSAAPVRGQPMMGSGGGPGGGWSPSMMMGPGMMGWGAGGSGMGMLCDPRAAGLAEWRMERIEQAVQPTEAQRAALNALKAASAKAAEQIAAACPREFPASSAARLDLMEKRMETMLAALKVVRPAFDAFYATLSDEQKARLDRGGPRRWGWRNWGPRSP